MFIANAYAQANEALETLAEPAVSTEAHLWNMGLIGLIVILFYLLLIRPQQKRFKEHSEMIAALKKGDKVVTGGGLIGKIDKIEQENDEVVIDLGSGVKVTALRSTIHGKNSPLLAKKPANDAEDKKKKN